MGSPVDFFKPSSWRLHFFIICILVRDENSVLFKRSSLIICNHVSLCLIIIKKSFCLSLTFFHLIKPVKWVHPILCSLPESLLDFMGSPLPILIGLQFNLLLNHVCLVKVSIKIKNFLRKIILETNFLIAYFISLTKISSNILRTVLKRSLIWFLLWTTSKNN